MENNKAQRKGNKMRLTIDKFEVEIKAKGVYGDRFNKKDTIALLNKISLLAVRAADYYSGTKYEALQDEAESISAEIYNFLDSIGAYNN